jgi:beta-glucosidase
VSNQRLDESVRRLLRVKFQLGLFDDPFVDEDVAEEILGAEPFRAAGHRAQAESVVLLHNGRVGGRPVLPLADGVRIYVEGLPADEAARLGQVVDDPAEADVALVRVPAPFDPRDDLFLEAVFHQGSLRYRPGLLVRLRMLAETVPLVLNVNLERPAVLTPLTEFTSAIVGDVGCSPAALVDVLTGGIPPRGVLPFEIPRSAEAVLRSQTDVANDTEDPLYPAGFGLRYDS